MASLAELTPTRVCGFHSLPKEILRLVILEIYAPLSAIARAWSAAGQNARLAWLAASTPISRPWAAEVYPILYHSIDIRNHGQAVLLLRSIKRRPALAGLVRHLTMVPCDAAPAEPTTPRPWWHMALLHSLALQRGRRKYWKIYDELLRLCSAVTFCVTTPLDCGFLARYLQPTDLCICAIEDSVDLDGFTQLRALGLVGTSSLRPVQFSNCSGPQWHLNSLCLQDITVLGHDIMQLLSNLRLELEVLRCFGLRVTDEWGVVPFHHWITPVQDTLQKFYLDGTYSMPLGFRMLSNATFLLIDIAAIPYMRPEDYLPQTVRKVQFAGSWHAVSGRFIFLCAEQALRVVQADRTALPNLQTLSICLAVYNSADLATWQLLSFLLKEAARRRGREFEFNAVVTYWHGGDSFEWRDPGHVSRRGGNGRSPRLLDRPLTLARKVARKSGP